MPNCPECGKPIPTGYKICPSCGVGSTVLKVEIAAHINLLRKKIQMDPSNARLCVELGDLYHNHGLIHEALDAYLQESLLTARILMLKSDPPIFISNLEKSRRLRKVLVPLCILTQNRPRR